MEIKKPIFIIGVGRSGSTVFHQIFSRHPNVAWLSSLCNKFPNDPSKNKLLMKIHEYTITSRFLKNRLKPGECYEFWNYYYKGFRRPCRDLLATDVTTKTKNGVRNFFSEILTERRNRLLVKITGWPRIGFLREIFKDAKFIHIIRDGRAVVNSMVNVDWWWGWRGPQNWRWGELKPVYKKEWEQYNKSFIALVAIEWKILIDAMEETKKFIDKNSLLEIKYEDLCSHPQNVFKGVLEFSELQWSKKFAKEIKQYKLKNTNYKWQKELTLKQQNILEEILHDYFKKFNY
ncbi:hypothetical protein ES705_36662 [subsurface metagenome]